MDNRPWMHGVLDPFDERDVREWVKKSTRDEKRAFVDRIVFDLIDDSVCSGGPALLR